MRALMVMVMVVVVGISACSNRVANRVAFGASMAVLACDWAQTRTMAMDGWRDGYGRDRHELNPMLGPKPGAASVDTYFATAAIVSVLAQLAIPERYRSVIPGVVIGAEVSPIAGNVAMGTGLCGIGRPVIDHGSM